MGRKGSRMSLFVDFVGFSRVVNKNDLGCCGESPGTLLGRADTCCDQTRLNSGARVIRRSVLYTVAFEDRRLKEYAGRMACALSSHYVIAETADEGVMLKDI